MLKGIDQRLSAELVHALMLMGHGDDLVICDVNHPAATIAAETTFGRLIDMPGCDIPSATEAILSLMPLDSFVEPPVTRMQMVGNPDGTVPGFARMQAVLDRVEGRPVVMAALERFAFYEAAKRSFCIVRTSDSGPYGCFILKKGVIDLPPLA
ncbi:MAG: RbsD/FucU domain-containing protein [Hoeflea sp.]|uniref:RbsD/FucU family protein n=1 Tax=Hoeflea sp. TaxID=1940281 RepID=UPI00272F4965|nr:RbsD/FucU domain-containing protein [Hoeflea sp.]MDP2119720.1 RbsD/FucU domain-containing protein [Hoeflea sp.]